MVSFSRALSLTVAFANVGMGKSRVGESRGLGIRLPNPLSCQGNQLKEGDTLLVGQGICWSNAQYGVDTTRGAYEFGLDFDGTPVLYDHRTEEEEIVIWKPTGVSPGVKMLITGDSLTVEDAEGTVVWQVGGTGCGSGNGNGITKLIIDNGSTVKLRKGGNNVLWSVDLEGEVFDGCA